MYKIPDKLLNRCIFFVTPDIKRGLGLDGILPDYHIICGHYDPLIPQLRKQGVQIFCLEEKEIDNEKKYNNTGKILDNEDTVSYINKKSKETPVIMYFKPAKMIDYLIEKHKWVKAGNNFEINESYENKINLFSFLKKQFPDIEIPSLTGKLGDLKFSELMKTFSLPLVIQFGHGWAGKTTFSVNSEKDFLGLSQKYSQTYVKASGYIESFAVLNNSCIYENKIFVSPPAVQISGIKKLYPNSFVTCGRQWPVKFISGEQEGEIMRITQQVGLAMQKNGYKGFFGLDFLVDKSCGKIYLSEINARLTASSAFFTKLELGCGKIPLMLYHLASFLNISLSNYDTDYPEFKGSQIIFRDGGGQPVKHNPELFGLFKQESQESVYINNLYQPDQLEDRQYIFLKRKLFLANSKGEETARIETKMEVLQTAKSLAGWVDRLII
ncbi:ATP-grasp domain-containing protein [Candidatus Gottesmanbacteria bacterium]|nr:ATP-grasp domain-containing protein [Candidatus Gottesmanbacteria bacterium]